ncbi:MAG: hypothetical protein OXH71_06345 [Candidatus Dadabacteria bacterium]|nr:hypothetical protein [Candidatus Dadabacteria bacterium]MDE0520289.1 hypothetical protein [Candidatus Dadabacteria bacterium]MDE0663489.1 hypothetical protein [Candidatus Dadabacteria bacterium]
MSSIFSTPQTTYDTLEQDTELQIALSQILYGCVPHATGEECVMIFKESPEKVAVLGDIRGISTRFFEVEKEEFPSVAMEIRITTGKNLKLKYEYFFLTESSEEVFFLSTLARLGVFSLIFLCDDAHCAITAEMTQGEIEPLKSIVTAHTQAG